jgi:hypothetical protein
MPARAYRIWDPGSGASKFPNSQSHITVGDLQLTYHLHSWLFPYTDQDGNRRQPRTHSEGLRALIQYAQRPSGN